MEFKVIVIIIVFILFAIMTVVALYINHVWYKDCQEINTEWTEYCKKIIDDHFVQCANCSYIDENLEKLAIQWNKESHKKVPYEFIEYCKRVNRKKE